MPSSIQQIFLAAMVLRCLANYLVLSVIISFAAVCKLCVVTCSCCCCGATLHYDSHTGL